LRCGSDLTGLTRPGGDDMILQAFLNSRLTDPLSSVSDRGQVLDGARGTVPKNTPGGRQDRGSYGAWRSTALNKQSTPHGVARRDRERSGTVPRDELEDVRRRQLIEVTIDSLAEAGYVGSTLAQIANRAKVSPGLVAHYFHDKDSLLEAAFRTLGRRLADGVRARMRGAHTPRGRIQAIIDTNLGPEEFTQRTGSAWLAYWGQVLHVHGLKRVQDVYQRRMLSNLRHALKRMLPAGEARSLAATIAAMIDGVWLRAALSNWQEADSESARALLTAFVDARLMERALPTDPATDAAGSQPRLPVRPDTFASINPATGAVLARIKVDGPEQIEAAVRLAQSAQRKWAATSGTERGRILRRAAELLRARNDELAHLETCDTGKPIQETRVVDVVSGADCFEYFAGLAASLSGEHL